MRRKLSNFRGPSTNSVYGVRHLAQKWQDDGTIKNIKAFILEDMIGDADLNVERDRIRPPGSRT